MGNNKEALININDQRREALNYLGLEFKDKVNASWENCIANTE